MSVALAPRQQSADDRIAIVVCDDRENEQWDRYVCGHPQGTPYHRWAWGQMCQQAYGHQLAYFAAQFKGEIVGVLPVVILKRPFAAQQCCSLPFGDLGGALANDGEIAQALKSYAYKALGAHVECRESGFSVVDEDDKRMQGRKVRMVLELPETADALMASFKSKLRSQIRKAEKNGLTVLTGRSEALLLQFYHVFCVNMRDLGSPVHSYRWFASLLQHYKQDCLIAVVYTEGLPIAGGIVLFSPNGTAIPWASTIAQYNHLSPNMLLYWTLLSSGYKENRFLNDRDIAGQFDFGRSTMGEGTYRFKRQWGAVPVALEWQTDSSPAAQSRLKALVIKVWQKLPLPCANWIGPRVRGYISL